MIRHSAIAGLLAAFCLLLAGCNDTRRDAVRSYLQAHPPEGFETAEIPETIPVTKKDDGNSESVLTVKYRLKDATVEMLDASTQPRGLALAKRIAAVRGWALASLPAGDPTREKIVGESAHDPIPAKRIVTPAGQEFETLAIVTLHKESDKWLVTPESLDVHVPGTPDRDRSIPFQDSAEVATKLDDLEKLAKHLEESRQEYLAERERTAARSLAALRSRLRTGNVFSSRLPDRSLLRLVISRGAEGDEPVVAVVNIQRGDQSSARFTGAFVQQPSGDYSWRSAQVTTLSGTEPLTDANLHPVLVLAANGQALSGQITEESLPPVPIRFESAEKVDLLPEASTKVTNTQ